MGVASRVQAQFVPRFRSRIRFLSTTSAQCESITKLDSCASGDSFRSKMYDFANRIKAAGDNMDLARGKLLHAEAQAEGLASQKFVSSALVCLYGKCGTVVEAEDAFQAVFQPDTVLCNAMLAAYVKLDQGEKILLLFRQMSAEDIAVDLISYISALQACGLLVRQEKLHERHHVRQACCEVGHALHSEAKKRGFTKDARISTTLVCMYAKCHHLSEAENVFLISAAKNVVSWNAMMAAYIELGLVDMPLRLYKEMETFGIKPDHITIVFALQACRIITEMADNIFLSPTTNKFASLEICRALHAVARNMGLGASAYVGTTLVNVYGKCDSITDAEEVFVSMSTRTVVSWNAMLSAYVDLGQFDKALLLFRQMQQEGFSPDQQTIVCALHACGNLVKTQKTMGSDEASLFPILEIGRCLHSIIHNAFCLSL